MSSNPEIPSQECLNNGEHIGDQEEMGVVVDNPEEDKNKGSGYGEQMNLIVMAGAGLSIQANVHHSTVA